MKRFVCLVLSLLFVVALCTCATAECDENCTHLCRHECGYCHADLLNEDVEDLTGPQLAVVEKMYAQPAVSHLDAKYVGVCLYDTDVFFRPNSVKVGQIFEKDDVLVIETGKYWYTIVFEDEFVGYVRSKAVELIDVNIPGCDSLYRVANTGGNRHAFVRDCPCGDSEIVARLNRDTYVRVEYFYNSRWVYVTYDAAGNQGFMRYDLLKVSHRFEQ